VAQLTTGRVNLTKKLSSCLLSTSSIQMSTVADEQHNTIKFITLKANIKIQTYLQYIFYYSFLKHTIF